jgi:hypothetical protein
MTKEEAVEAFRALVARYGLDWDFSVPPSALQTLCEINGVLATDSDRREALGLPARSDEERS